jgi:hypothetical protein
MPNIHCLHVLGGAVTVQPALLDDPRKVIDMRYVIDRRHGGILTLAKDSGTTFFQPQSPQINTFRPPFAIHVFMDYPRRSRLYEIFPLLDAHSRVLDD